MKRVIKKVCAGKNITEDFGGRYSVSYNSETDAYVVETETSDPVAGPMSKEEAEAEVRELTNAEALKFENLAKQEARRRRIMKDFILYTQNVPGVYIKKDEEGYDVLYSSKSEVIQKVADDFNKGRGYTAIEIDPYYTSYGELHRKAAAYLPEDN